MTCGENNMVIRDILILFYLFCSANFYGIFACLSRCAS